MERRGQTSIVRGFCNACGARSQLRVRCGEDVEPQRTPASVQVRHLAGCARLRLSEAVSPHGSARASKERSTCYKRPPEPPSVTARARRERDPAASGGRVTDPDHPGAYLIARSGRSARARRFFFLRFSVRSPAPLLSSYLYSRSSVRVLHLFLPLPLRQCLYYPARPLLLSY